MVLRVLSFDDLVIFLLKVSLANGAAVQNGEMKDVAEMFPLASALETPASLTERSCQEGTEIFGGLRKYGL